MFFKFIVRVLGVCFVFCGSSAFAISAQELQDSINEVRDFSHYTARHPESTSREEALEALKDHVSSMVDYHTDMQTMYLERAEKYKDKSQKQDLFCF